MAKDLDKELAQTAERHHGIFATHHLDDLNFSRESSRRQSRDGPVGVGPRWSLPDGRFAGHLALELLAACWAGGSRALGSHRSAAALWSLPAGRTDVTEIDLPEVAAGTSRRSPRP